MPAPPPSVTALSSASFARILEGATTIGPAWKKTTSSASSAPVVHPSVSQNFRAEVEVGDLRVKRLTRWSMAPFRFGVGSKAEDIRGARPGLKISDNFSAGLLPGEVGYIAF